MYSYEVNNIDNNSYIFNDEKKEIIKNNINIIQNDHDIKKLQLSNFTGNYAKELSNYAASIGGALMTHLNTNY